jgi:hypothetical protein
VSVERWVNYLKNLPRPPRLAPIINKKIDEILHPLAEKNKLLYIVDAVAHTVVEQADSLVLSAYKAIRYNLDKIVEGERSEKPRA